MTTHTRLLTLACCAALALAGCGQPQAEKKTAATTTSEPNSSTAQDSSGLTVSDAWVKAAPELSPDSMTGAFGRIKNTTDRNITITKAEQDASMMTELHETVMIDGKKAMREIKDGFVIKAGQTLELKPYDNHIMLMKMTRALPIGAEVKFTLHTKDGKTMQFTAPAKQFTAPPENYHSSTPTATTK
ncbi:copper chaperone PCu(A)C [Austwickia chelonae]|uniref:copper chaperone PCu(A)C n=1 Tax=Austwickia chelonae TaxID=100225 RepID=UPI0013C33C91|nr:copper chaperone PCu(A)C [Austwickia chelonae]